MIIRPLTLAASLTVMSFAAPHASLEAQVPSPAPELPPSPYVVEVLAVDYAFKAPDAVPSGWTTIRFRNTGQDPHMVIVSRLPEGITIRDYATDLSQPYNNAWRAIRDETLSRREAVAVLVEELPEWYSDLEFLGGVGVLSPGRTSETTVHLKPGNYVLECYMKTEDGERHDWEGMIRPLLVTEESSGAVPPAADIRVTLSNYEMEVEGELVPGGHTVAVHVEENPEQGYPHNAHLARLDADTKIEEVVQWMKAFDLDGLQRPAPAEFIGGVHMMPAGSTGYFTVDLEPGRYLLISEITAAQGVLHEFTVR